MGKLADNERIKLKASFFNTLGAGLYLGGTLIPYLGLMQHLSEISERLDAGPPFKAPEIWRAIAWVTALVVAYYSGRRFRRRADKIIQTLQD